MQLGKSRENSQRSTPKSLAILIYRLLIYMGIISTVLTLLLGPGMGITIPQIVLHNEKRCGPAGNTSRKKQHHV